MLGRFLGVEACVPDDGHGFVQRLGVDLEDQERRRESQENSCVEGTCCSRCCRVLQNKQVFMNSELALTLVCSAAHTVCSPAGVLRFRQVSRMQSEGSTRGIHGTAMSRAVRDAHLAAQLIPADA